MNILSGPSSPHRPTAVFVVVVVLVVFGLHWFSSHRQAVA